jgi:hypothetical protein
MTAALDHERADIGQVDTEDINKLRRIEQLLGPSDSASTLAEASNGCAWRLPWHALRLVAPVGHDLACSLCRIETFSS